MLHRVCVVMDMLHRVCVGVMGMSHRVCVGVTSRRHGNVWLGVKALEVRLK